MDFDVFNIIKYGKRGVTFLADRTYEINVLKQAAIVSYN